MRVHNRARPLLADTVAALRARRAAGVALRDDVPWVRLVAELDEKVVATGRAIEASGGPVSEPGVVYVGIEVDPGVAGRGVGHLLFEQVRIWAQALGAERLRCLVDLEDERSVAITKAWGFSPGEPEEHPSWNYVLDVSRLERARLTDMLLPGVEVVPLATRFDDDAFCRAVHEVHDEGRADIPSAEPFPATVYEDWRAGELRRAGDGGVTLVACQTGVSAISGDASGLPATNRSSAPRRPNRSPSSPPPSSTGRSCAGATAAAASAACSRPPWPCGPPSGGSPASTPKSPATTSP